MTERMRQTLVHWGQIIGAAGGGNLPRLSKIVIKEAA